MRNEFTLLVSMVLLAGALSSCGTRQDASGTYKGTQLTSQQGYNQTNYSEPPANTTLILAQAGDSLTGTYNASSLSFGTSIGDVTGTLVADTINPLTVQLRAGATGCPGTLTGSVQLENSKQGMRLRGNLKGTTTCGAQITAVVDLLKQ